MKFAELGATTRNLQVQHWANDYFLSPHRKYDDKGVPIFENEQQRFHNEMFQVFRTMQHIMLPGVGGTHDSTFTHDEATEGASLTLLHVLRN
jgi:hypothetical protein